MMSTTLRQLAPAAAAGLALSLLSTLPAGAHGLAGAGLAAGASHPLLGLDHLLLLLGVGGAAALAGPSLLLVALAAAISGGLYGALGGNLPGAEVLAALMVSGLGLALAARQGQLLAVVLAGGVVIHAMLHGQEATGSSADLLGWWLGASLSSAAVVGASFAVIRQLAPSWGRRLAGALCIGGALLALAQLA
ncbi:HupE/UreJ family protein [Cyanobium sp. L1E-Cus]|nr:HupE/UreJ family protein [Cyanobium sp. L1E-Cus]